ncbi:hypothetical protein [uncultured Brachyspira sp.]|uniref:hypothetical protein n=1 Tax=uncultured Brachyspira sp. TaxID=221953 RepID=UPI002602FA0A|nr:hypothetical protein [uncultured Brachyspira sp.]
MKRIIFILSITSALIISCNSNNAPTIGEKPLTSNVPSDDKTVREGTPLSQWNDSDANIISVNSSSVNLRAANASEYTLLDRLYSTVWYQSESDYDDGRLETEEEFIFFNSSSEICKREYENGRIDGRDEYSTLRYINYVSIPNAQNNRDRNACIVQNIEKYDNDADYEGYYLVDRNTLYIVDGDREDEIQRKLSDIISGNTQKYREDKFVLSTKSLN